MRRFPAMGTTVVVRAERAADFEETRRLFGRIEERCSRFLPDSELMRVNRSPASAVPLSAELRDVIHSAEIARRRTGGLVDVGMGSHLAALGYDRTFFDVADLPAPRSTATGPVEWHLAGDRLVRPPGVSIDLGGIAKGWTCDRAVDGGFAVLVGAGGDIRSADPATTVEVLDPWGEPALTVRVGVGALATSSVTRRRWRVAGREVHHLIDPRTLRPASTPVLSATAITETAVEAEAAAKAILLRGTDGLGWAAEQRWIRGAVVVWHDGSVYATTNVAVVT